MSATPNPDISSPLSSLPLSSFSLDATGVQSLPRADSEPLADRDSAANANAGAPPDVDPQIVEALKSKDRIYVLKLGEQMESLINDRRCSTYYKLAPETDPISKVITVLLTPESRIPARRIAELVPAQSPTQPTFKIMRRSPTDRQRPKPHSQAGSVAGEDAELSDPEPSEAGSLGGRSNATGSSKKHKTIEEREAAYNEARSRIFMNFDEKERGKEKDLSASSSTVSLTSGSVTSAGEISSTGDIDDSVSSPTTESEWSGPVVRDKDGRRSNGSSRSLRSTGPSFNGSNSSRGSRAPSPSSFKYPTLYEPSPTAVPYDLSQAPAPAPGYGNPYMYAYPHPAPPAPNFIPPYHYYAAYPYPHPQTSIQNVDPGSPSNQADVYPPQPPQHQGVYLPYPWHSPPPAHPPTQHRPMPAPSPPIAPPASQYSGYTPPVPPYGPYPMPFYPSPPAHLTPPSSSPAQNQTHYSSEYNGAHDPYASNRSYPGVVGQQPSTMGLKPRGAPPARSAWSYGPGIGMGGFGVNGNSGRPVGSGEVVGPRLSSTVRKHPGNLNRTVGVRTPATDEASSPASSSTSSSSSRRTYTSTSSQHPLPARPDWAVGLKPQPTLHATHRHHEHPANARNMSPARSNGQQRAQQVPPPLQSTDFPPLTMNAVAEKRVQVTGVWNNSSSTRSILMPGNNATGNALVSHSGPPVCAAATNSTIKPDEAESTSERPTTKGVHESVGSKGAWKPGCAAPNRSPNPQDKVDKERLRGEVVANAILVDKIALLSVEERDGESPVNAANGAAPVALAT